MCILFACITLFIIFLLVLCFDCLPLQKKKKKREKEMYAIAKVDFAVCSNVFFFFDNLCAVMYCVSNCLSFVGLVASWYFSDPNSKVSKIVAWKWKQRKRNCYRNDVRNGGLRNKIILGSHSWNANELRVSLG